MTDTAPEVTLTPAELEEFTLLNALAFDISRSEAKQKDTTPPFWLCTSPEAKQAAQKRAYEILAQQFMIVVNDPVSANRALRTQLRGTLDKTVEQWKLLELDAKTRRETHDLSGFFIPHRQ